MISLPLRAVLLLPVLFFCVPLRAVPPAAPIINTMTWNGSNNFSASWQDKSNDEAGFWLVYRTSPAGNFSILRTMNANATSTSFMPDSSFRVCDIIFEWAIVAYKGSGASQEYSFSTTTVKLKSPPPAGTTQCPPAFWVNDYYSGGLNESLVLQASAYKRTSSSNGTAVALASGITATGLPPGVSIDGDGTFSGAPTAVGRYTITLNAQESGGPLGTNTMKLTVFRPVPVTVAPANTTPLPDRTLRRNAAPGIVDLGAHFNDPDVTDASRLVFNSGTIDFLYYPDAAPANVANFKGYISRGDLVNTIIHRSLPGFVIQGGGYKAEAGTPSITRQPAVVNEPEITNGRGTVAMAKSAGNPNSATSEFFINLADNAANLNDQNEGFTVFARVSTPGMAIADLIAGYCTYAFSATNPVLENCPVNTHAVCPVPKPPTPAFSTDFLVKIISAGPVAPLSYAVESSAPTVCGAAVDGAQLSLTPLTAGAATITVTTTDLDNQTITRPFNVVVEEHLADWLAAQNFPNPGDATAAADPDGDSAPSIMEFGLMTDPQSPDPVPAPLAGTASAGDGSYLALTFPVRKFTGSGFAYAVERHDALTGTWTSVWTSADGFSHAQVVNFTDQPDRTVVTVRDTVAIASGARTFLRLRVTDTP